MSESGNLTLSCCVWKIYHIVIHCGNKDLPSHVCSRHIKEVDVHAIIFHSELLQEIRDG